MYKCVNGIAPYYLCDQITMMQDVVIRETRSSNVNNVLVPHASLEYFKKSFAYQGPVIWNALPDDAKSS